MWYCKEVNHGCIKIKHKTITVEEMEQTNQRVGDSSTRKSNKREKNGQIQYQKEVN